MRSFLAALVLADGSRQSAVGSRQSMRCLLAALVLAVPPGVRAAAPVVTYLFPAGGQRGSAVEVQAGGTFATWPVQVWTSAAEVEARPGKARGSLHVTVAAGARPGTYWLRLFNADGASRLCPFVVGTLPEVLEKEPNDDPKKPQRLEGSQLVVNGRLAAAGDVDHYALTLKKGQTLVASVMANQTLGSPMDAILQTLSAEGFVLAANNDWHGLDPQVIFPVSRDGVYLVRLFAFPAVADASIRLAGGPAYVYRLTLTTGGFADHAFPLAVSLKDPLPVRLAGWNLPETARAIGLRPDRPSESWPVYAAGVANAVAVRVEPHAALVKTQPKPHARPQVLRPPVTVSGHIDPPGESDGYALALRKGQQLAFQVEAHSLDSPLDPVLRVSDAAGKLLQEVDDTPDSLDPELAFAAPADGTYHVEVRDLHGRGGWRYVYRLRAVLAQPDYTLTVPADRFAGSAGGALEIPVTVVRRNGFTGPVEVKIEGLPAGTRVVSSPPAAGAAASIALKLQAPANPFSGPLRIVGHAPGLPGGTRTARAALPPLKTQTELLWLTVRPAKGSGPQAR